MSMLVIRGVPIYGIAENGDLYWYKHRGFDTGRADWSSRGQGLKVGTGWHEGGFVLKGSPRGDDGVIYRVDGFDNLLWYRHLGHRGDGREQQWVGGKQIGEGWHNARLVFSGGQGIIYMVNRQGELLWYRHEGYHDGTRRWAKKATVGSGWEIARTAFSDGHGIVYLVTRRGDLYWYRHHGYQDGSTSWADRKLVGTSWDIAPDIFSGGAGLIYTVRRDGNMYWYRHTGWASGAATWEASTGRKIGSGWGSYLRIF